VDIRAPDRDLEASPFVPNDDGAFAEFVAEDGAAECGRESVYGGRLPALRGDLRGKTGSGDELLEDDDLAAVLDLEPALARRHLGPGVRGWRNLEGNFGGDDVAAAPDRAGVRGNAADREAFGERERRPGGLPRVNPLGLTVERTIRRGPGTRSALP
jgi:hypothetical protein